MVVYEFERTDVLHQFFEFAPKRTRRGGQAKLQARFQNPATDQTLQTHLENFKSEHPIVAVALSAQPIRPASQQFGLFETALRNPQQLYETLARLSALLGSDRVGTPIREETHRTDAFRREPFVWQVGAIDPNRPE